MKTAETKPPHAEEHAERIVIDAARKHYKVLNNEIRAAINNGAKIIELMHVNGQRYIADGINSRVKIIIHGTPGNNLGSFMDGPEIVVLSNAQEQVANTMNSGKIIILGSASDVIGYGMRGGKVFVRGDAGYRIGIHMKEYKRHVPMIVIGGTTGDFLGEYMAGGVIVVLGIGRAERLAAGRVQAEASDRIVGDYVGTGMHGGAIFVRGEEIPPDRLGKEPRAVALNDTDQQFFRSVLKEFCEDVDFDFDEVVSQPFFKYVPQSHRPYGSIYAPQP
jgi:glutamate synthase domain-containing protein 3